jgi:L-lysine exporter family protein LysE/ArgO
MLPIFARGVVLGLGLVMPLGPQNAFIFQRASSLERFSYLLPVLFVSILCDAALVLGAILGGQLLDPLIRWQSLISILGACFLLYLSWGMWKSASVAAWTDQVRPLSVGQQVLYTFSVSLLNPHAILDTFFVIGSVSAKYIGLEKHVFAFGCILVDALWFIGLGVAGFYLRRMKNGDKAVRMTNRISAVIMFIIAVDLLLKIVN